MSERSPRRASRTAIHAILAVACALVSSGAMFAAGGERVRVEDLAVRVDPAAAVVSYRLEGTIPDDVVERLGAGIAVTFRHRIELVQKRSFFAMPARTVHRCEIESTATYDSLTKQYALERVVRHRPSQGAPAGEIIESRTTESVDDVRAWIAVVSVVEVPLGGLRPSGGRARIKVESILGRRYVLGMFPSAISAEAEVDLDP